MERGKKKKLMTGQRKRATGLSDTRLSTRKEVQRGGKPTREKNSKLDGETRKTRSPRRKTYPRSWSTDRLVNQKKTIREPKRKEQTEKELPVRRGNANTSKSSPYQPVTRIKRVGAGRVWR